MNLAQARERRESRGEELRLARIDELLDQVLLATADVTPTDRKKLRGIIDRLRTKHHPFSQCMRDLRKHQPGWSEEHREKTCGVLKKLAGRSGDGKTNASDESGACVLLDDATATMLEAVDLDALDEVEYAREHDDFAVLTAKSRKDLPASAFVFPKERRYPIHDIGHARNALARSSGKPEEAAVRAAVYRRYPALRPKKKEDES